MRRATSIVALGLMLVVAVGATVSAKGQGSATAVTFSADAGTGPEGGWLPLSATVHNATPGTTFTAVAIVHFATGDVSVKLGPGDLTPTSRTTRHHERDPRNHQGWWWWRHHHRPGPKPTPAPGVDLTETSEVPIAGEEPMAAVPVDVTFTYGGQVVTVSTTGHVDGYSG